MSDKSDRERRIFKAFLRIEPESTGEPLAKWEQHHDENDFPDSQAVSVSGRRVGVELGKWLHQQDIQAAKAKEVLEASILIAIGEQGPNRTQHIRYVWLHPKPKSQGRGHRGSEPAEFDL